ncbi:MOSC domain-containing protein [Actinacidiphila yeochonensis]|uniref:MOSC domain-containing protein n=1 Tax=Actinacidiphila yeochonensis TaxID=89050 RepID=UPI00056248B9|nr:MOSC domain-containing protein [Actinacidiphila yeochonensis]
MGTLSALYRYPVKSMLGEELESAAVTARGLAGDRRFAVLDTAGAVGSAKHPRKWGALLRCRSRTAGGSGGAESGEVLVVLPDGTELSCRDRQLDARLSKLLGREVALSDLPPEQGRLERAVPEYAGGIPEAARRQAEVDATGTAVTVGSVAAGTFLDFGRLHLVTTSSLERLRAARPAGDADPRRFRPNLVVDTGGAPGYPEDAWTGSLIRVGEALLRVVVPTPRCVVPTLGHGELPPDPALMRVVAREHRVPVFDMGPLSCVGVYLDVVEPGTVRVGDRVAPTGTA